VTEPAIVVDDVWKRFRVYQERPSSLKERITKLARDRYQDFWALKGVSVTVPYGSVYGLVGHNGSGKSSLLRIMAGIHRPTKGTVHTNGRISALLELGAGFHPDLSGRENIYLNAAILGLSKKETDNLYGRIVEFSGLSDFIDTPVKHYSSGMYVRLGFSVAVHVDPQILLVDEVIAVGDEEFQRRCFEHLNRLRTKGTTIVIVTHSLDIVQTMCDEATWLDHGEPKAQGTASEVTRKYLSQVNEHEVERIEREAAAGNEDAVPHGTVMSVEGVEFVDAEGRSTPAGTTLEPLTIRVHWRADEPVQAPLFSFVVWRENGEAIANPGMLPVHDDDAPVYQGSGFVDYRIDRLPLSPGVYTITAAAHDRMAMTVYDRIDMAATLHVQPGARPVRGVVDLVGTWEPLVAASSPAEPRDRSPELPDGAKLTEPANADARVQKEKT
jgi:ABC-2 type transport system ATP-binding protein/lipopolysaccharide transport system ATP-binding protein